MSAPSEVSRRLFGAGRDRIRALVFPREHGAWGILLVPLFTGVLVRLPSARQLYPLLLFTIAALSLFWLRTPVESLLGSSPISVRSPQEHRITLLASAVLSLLSLACLIGLMWRGRHRQLLLIGAIAACAFLVQVILRKLGRSTRMASQVVGAVGLTSTAAAAYYLGAGRLDSLALALWVTNWLFAWNQIHFVQLRIHSARAVSFRDKLTQARYFVIEQVLLLAGLVFAALWRLVPPLVILAFAPALLRGMRWLSRAQEPLDMKSLGWSELKQGFAFGVLLSGAFLLR